jgi:hypothetical protein
MFHVFTQICTRTYVSSVFFSPTQPTFALESSRIIIWAAPLVLGSVAFSCKPTKKYEPQSSFETRNGSMALALASEHITYTPPYALACHRNDPLRSIRGGATSPLSSIAQSLAYICLHFKKMRIRRFRVSIPRQWGRFLKSGTPH